MKQLIAWFAAFFLVTFDSNAQHSFLLKADLENLKAPARLILTVRAIGEWKEFTAESSNGHFEIKGSVHETAFAFLVMKYLADVDKPPEATNILHLMIADKPILINSRGELQSATISAGEPQMELELLKTSLRALAPDQQVERAQVVNDFVVSHPHSFVSIYALQDFNVNGSFKMETEKVAPLYDLLSKEIKESLLGQELKRDIAVAQRTAMGSIAPDFMQADTLQNNVSLKSFRGKYVFIDFWASWCKPCRAENPELVKAFELFKDKNFTILGISLDNNRTSWLKAIRKDGLAWTHVSDLKFWKNEVALLYGVKTIPQNFILDPNGKIIGKNIHSKDLISWLAKEIK